MSVKAILGSAAGDNAGTPTYSDDVFSAYTYTGNGATQTINNGINLSMVVPSEAWSVISSATYKPIETVSDLSGNLYIAANSSPYGFISKYDSSNSVVWTVRIADTVLATVSIGGINRDANGDIIVVCSAGARSILIKIDSAGTILWQQMVSGLVSGASAGNLCSDSLNNIYVATSIPGATVNSAQFLKYDSAGTAVGAFDHGLYFSASYQSLAHDVGIDASNNVYFVGSYVNSSSISIGYIIKFDSTGAFQWKRDTGSNTSVQGCAVTSIGECYANVGFSTGQALVKYDSSGTIQWQRKTSDTVLSSTNKSICLEPYTVTNGQPYIAPYYTDPGQPYIAPYYTNPGQPYIAPTGNPSYPSGLPPYSPGQAYIAPYNVYATTLSWVYSGGPTYFSIVPAYTVYVSGVPAPGYSPTFDGENAYTYGSIPEAGGYRNYDAVWVASYAYLYTNPGQPYIAPTGDPGYPSGLPAYNPGQPYIAPSGYNPGQPYIAPTDVGIYVGGIKTVLGSAASTLVKFNNTGDWQWERAWNYSVGGTSSGITRSNIDVNGNLYLVEYDKNSIIVVPKSGGAVSGVLNTLSLSTVNSSTVASTLIDTAGAGNVYVPSLTKAAGNSTTTSVVISYTKYNQAAIVASGGGLVWTQARNYTVGGNLVDTIRGANNILYPFNTNAQQVPGTTITGFTSTGYILGNDIISNFAYNYVSWTFKKAAKFFDVVTYTGNGANRTISHSLGLVPGMIMVKRTDAIGSWIVYHNAISNTENLVLNTSTAKVTNATTWNSTTATSSEFSLGTHADVNTNAGTYVAYIFAHDTSADGLIQCGSFTTNASGIAPDVVLGWEPQYVLFKPISTAVDWNIVDTSRVFSLAAPYNENLSPNTTSGAINYGRLTLKATGFKVGADLGAQTYIYMAIRKSNKPPISGTQIYNAIAYTGNGISNREITGVGFAPDLTFLKSRSNGGPGNDWLVNDRLRGAGPLIFNTTDITQGSQYGTKSLSMNGVIFDTNITYQNNSGYTYIDYFFKRAPGVFDIITYTGTGSQHSEPHSLGAIPELVITKGTNFTGDWYTWCGAIGDGADSGLALNLSIAKDPFHSPFFVYSGGSLPTSSVINVSSGAGANNLGSTFVAYLFATKAGISKVGSYTGTGTALPVNCGFTTGARYVLIKRTDAVGDWYVFDTLRGISSGFDPYVFLNSNAAEITDKDFIDPISSGFELSAGSEVTQGQQAYTTPGSYTWICPVDVTSVSVVCVGAGGSAAYSAQYAASGGGLGYKNNISVIPGNSYSVVVGAAVQQSDGGSSNFNGVCAGYGGRVSPAGGNPAPGGTYLGDGGGNGGTSRLDNFSGGGGAGGYSGSGGNGGSAGNAIGLPGAGGGGAGGGYYGAGAGGRLYGGGGGGVGILGQGTSGVYLGYGGGGGSGGANGADAGDGSGGAYGGAAGCGADGLGGSSPPRFAGGGAVRIIWPGSSRQFPSTGTVDSVGTVTIPNPLNTPGASYIYLAIS